MEIGQKVRFLNEVGGGVISGFQGKDIVLVEDADGFDIPMLRSQIVVIETSENNFELKNPPLHPVAGAGVRGKGMGAVGNSKGGGDRRGGASGKVGSPRFVDDGADDDPSERDVKFQPKPVERKGGDVVNVHLAFIPENVRELTQTRFESYLINDSNYYLHVIVSAAENAAWHLIWEGVVEPNTKVQLNTFDRSDLPQLERLSVQAAMWKLDKPYMLKPAVDASLRIDTVKFYKLHVFRQSPFFREPALIYDIVSQDEATATYEDEISDNAVQEQSLTEKQAEEQAVAKADEKAARKLAKAQYKKEQAERDPHVSKPHRSFRDNVIEVDLHISALLDNTNGLSNSVLLNTQLTEFRTIMERNRTNKGQKIVFIHGKGEGVLREAIIKELRHRYRNCEYQDASFREYGYGATLVTIH